MALLAHIAFSGGGQLLAQTSINPLFIIIWQAAIVGALLVYIRYVLHHALLEEAAHMGFAETVCPSCHMHIVASGFCPNCGMALTAAPSHLKRSRRERKESTTRTSRRELSDGTGLPPLRHPEPRRQQLLHGVWLSPERAATGAGDARRCNARFAIHGAAGLHAAASRCLRGTSAG